MTFEDKRFDSIRELLETALIESDINLAKQAYIKMKSLQTDYIKKYLNSKNIEEQVLYDILELMMSFDSGADNETHIESSEELARIFKFDPEMRKYCEEQIENDGIVAKLEHQIHFKDKNNYIKEALELTKI